MRTDHAEKHIPAKIKERGEWVRDIMLMNPDPIPARVLAKRIGISQRGLRHVIHYVRHEMHIGVVFDKQGYRISTNPDELEKEASYMTANAVSMLATAEALNYIVAQIRKAESMQLSLNIKHEREQSNVQ